jgi:hypothetical protein
MVGSDLPVKVGFNVGTPQRLNIFVRFYRQGPSARFNA